MARIELEALWPGQAVHQAGAAGPSGREAVDDAVAAATKPSSDTTMCRISRRCAFPLIL